MKVTIFKDRKPTDENYELAAIDDSSLAALVSSLGEERVLNYARASVRSAFANAHGNQVKDNKTPAQITTWAGSWRPSNTARAKMSPAQRIRNFAEKQGIDLNALQKMLVESF